MQDCQCVVHAEYGSLAMKISLLSYKCGSWLRFPRYATPVVQ